MCLSGMRQAKSKPRTQSVHQVEEYGSLESIYGVESIQHTVARQSGKKYYVNLQLSVLGQRFYSLRCQIDTAATVNVMPRDALRYLTANPDNILSTSDTTLEMYNNSTVTPCGQCTLLCQRDNQLHQIDFPWPVTDTRGKSPLITGIDSLCLNWSTFTLMR